jgi:hypothetical protein
MLRLLFWDHAEWGVLTSAAEVHGQLALHGVDPPFSADPLPPPGVARSFAQGWRENRSLGLPSPGLALEGALDGAVEHFNKSGA